MLPENALGLDGVRAVSRPAETTVHRRRLGQRGVSLVELSVVVTITGILATLATYSVRERMFEAHSIEAISMLGNIRSGLMAKSHDLTGNSGNTLQIGGRVGGFGGPLGLPGVLGGPGNGNDDDSGGSADSGNPGDSDGDGNKGHGNNEGGCDPDNPGNSGKQCEGNSGSGDGSDQGGDDNNGGGADGDGDKGHGNNEGGCDPDNPGNSGRQCDGNDSGSDDDADGGDGSGSDVEGERELCGSASPVPSSLDSVKGQAYQSRPSDWSSSTTGGWSCLHVSMSMAQRFQYGYDLGSTAVPAGSAPAGSDQTLAAWARGDLDGDGRTSWFVLSGASFDGQVVMAPAVTMIDQGE